MLKSLTKLINTIIDGKVPDEIRPILFGAKLIALTKVDGGLRPIAVGNTIRRIASKCVGYNMAEQRAALFGETQVGCGTKRGAEIAAHLFRNLIESNSNKLDVILKLDFKNAFNSLNRETLLNYIFKTRSRIYKYTHAAYAKPSYLFYGESIIMSEEGTQQGDPEAPPLFAEVVQNLVKEMCSKHNIWYLDDGNLSDDYRTVLKDLKTIIAAEKELGLSLNSNKCEICFLGNPTNKQYETILNQFNKVCPNIKVTTRENLVVLGAPVGSTATKESLQSKIDDLEKIVSVVEHLDSHYGFYLLKNCFSMPKLLYILRTTPCFKFGPMLEEYDNIQRKALSKITNVNVTETNFEQACLPGKSGGLGLSSASVLAVPAFLASVSGAVDRIRNIFGETHEDSSMGSALETWFKLAKSQEAPFSRMQGAWSEPIYKVIIEDLLPKLGEFGVKRFNSFQDKFASQWLNVIPCKNLNLKLTDQQLRIAIGLRLGAKLCEKHKCVCGKEVDTYGLHGLSCTKSAGRFSRHANLNALFKQTLSSIKIPSILEPSNMFRTDGKRPDGVTLVPWASGRQMVWDVTVVDSLAPSRINAGSICNPGTTAADAEQRKTSKYHKLIDTGYLFQPLAFEVQGAMGPETELFVKSLCKKLCDVHDENRAGSFFKQRISLCIQIANAACVLGTVNDRDSFDEIYYL